MNILVVDDEPLARQRMIDLLSDLGEQYVVSGEAGNGREALQQVAQLKPDTVLLDIHMPGMSGIEVARHLSEQQTSPAIIFSTAYDEHALAAFEAHAIGYLLKPVNVEQLQRSLQTAQQLQQGQLQEIMHATDEKKRKHISVRLRGDMHLVQVKDVRYFRAEQKYVEMCHPEGISLIEDSLKSLEEEFPEQFMRIHRNALIAVNAITGLERDSLGRTQVLLDGCKEKLDVSRRHVAELRRLLKACS